MSDETEHDEHAGHRAFLVEDDGDFEYAIDCLLDVPVIRGDKPPVWTVETIPCKSGCHQHTVLIDTANDKSYLVSEIPMVVVEMTAAMGGALPDFSRIAVARRQSALN